MAETENVIIKDTLDGLGTDVYSNYLAMFFAWQEVAG